MVQKVAKWICLLLLVACLISQTNGLLTDKDDYNRIVRCSGSGYFDSIHPVFSHNSSALAGVGLSCSSGYVMIEGKGLVPANKDAPYYFGQRYNMTVNQQFFHKSATCSDQSAISHLEFNYQNEIEVVSVQLGCTSLQDVSNQTIQTIPLSDVEVKNQSAVMSCVNGQIVNGFEMYWTEESESILVSMDVVNCRQIKKQASCGPQGQLMDVSCQGIAHDCCIAYEGKNDVYECIMAGSEDIKAWYTSAELDNVETQICQKEDELTSGWFQIKTSTGICMNAITSDEAQFFSCSQHHSQWFRFVGNSAFQQMENGEFVGKCLNLANQTEGSDQIFLPVFDIVPCPNSSTEWNWTDGIGLSMQSRANPIQPRTKDIFPTAQVLSLDQDGAVIAKSFLDVLTAGSTLPVPRSSSIQPALKEGEIPGLIDSQLQASPAPPPAPPPATSIFLPPIYSTGNWSEEVIQVGEIFTSLYNESAAGSQFAGNVQGGVSSAPAYCERKYIVCDHMFRVVVIQLNSLSLPLAPSLSPAIFKLPRLRNFIAHDVGLTGELPYIGNNSEDVAEDSVIRQLSLTNNQFSGLLPSDWNQLQRLINVDLRGNRGMLQVGGSWLQLRVFGIPTTIDLDENVCANIDVNCDRSELLDRFPCLTAQCPIPATLADTRSQPEDNNNTTVIAATVIPVFFVFVLVVVILFVFVMRRRRQMGDWGRITTEMGMKQDYEKGGLGKPQVSGRLTPPKDVSGHFPPNKHEQPSLLERYLQDEGVVTWNTPPQYVVDWEIDYERDLVPKGTLGVGAMGSVQLAEWTDRKTGDKKLVAVKVFSRYLQPIYKDAVEVLNQKLILREVEVLMRVEHPNIVKCLGAILKPPNMGLVLEYMDVGNLDKYLHNICSARPINDRDKLIIMKQISRALDSLHPSVVHRDLKPQNILINSSGEIKLSDFGLSKIRQLQDAGRASSLQVLGTAPYTSPEVFRSNGMNVEDEKVDIYSLGIIMWEIWSMQRPWEGENMVAISYKVVNECRRPPMPHIIPPRLKNLIESCWDDDPKRRPSARDVQRMLEWMIEENDFKQSTQYREMRDEDASGSLDDESVCAVVKTGDSADHIIVPADESHESVCVSFIFPDGNTYEGKFEWRDTLLLLTDEVNDLLGQQPDGDTSRFRLHRIIEIQEQDPQVVEVDLTNISDTLQQHGFYTRNKIYVETLITQQ